MAGSDVVNFYKGKNVFITGGTGFLGICLIDKFLRTVPDVGNIYLLLRPKRGKEISERLEALTKNKIFETLLETASPDIFKKLIPISGEIGEEGLALSIEDRKLITENVNVVFHSAATLDFQQNLKPTVTINLLGTRRVMELCKEIKHLEVMIHVSSAYVNSFKISVEEILYPPPKEADKVITLATTLTDSALEALESNILENHPNTYTFTKHLAEHEVANCASLFPCVIVRPSIITGAWKEPVPGWTISKNGPQGFLMGTSRGVIRRLPVDKNIIADYIPVDVVVNELIVSGYKTARDKGPLAIYHCTSSTINPFKWALLEPELLVQLRAYPLKSAVWYPNVKFITNITLFRFSTFFVHFIPAIFLDLLTVVTGGRPILLKLHRNVNASLSRLHRFIFTEWSFDNTKTMQLSHSLSDTDKKLFPIDISTLEWKEYFKNLHLGVRTYINNEPMSNMPIAKTKQSILFLLHIVLRAFVIFTFWYTLSMCLGVTMKQAAWAAPLGYVLLNLI